jgi:hypothetical protein
MAWATGVVILCVRRKMAWATGVVNIMSQERNINNTSSLDHLSTDT